MASCEADSARPLITLTTDFGLEDTYVGQLKAALWQVAPHSRILDLSHGVAPGAIAQGAYLLASALPYLPAGAVHLAVVDPGVGGKRQALAARSARGWYVGPDNGLFTLAWEIDPWLEVVALDPHKMGLERVSATFQGRDLFAPAAARLAAGAKLEALGTPAQTPLALEWLRWAPGAQRGLVQIFHIDRFGNLILSLPQYLAPPNCQSLYFLGEELPLVATFCQVEPGQPLAYWGSGGYLEIGLRDASAAAHWALRLGQIEEIAFA